MLPFTKRPGRGDESEENDVVTKDDIDTSEVSKAKASGPVRGKFVSLSDDEMTNVIPSKAIDSALESARAASPRPAAGMPPAAASSGRTHLFDGPKSKPAGKLGGGANRSGKFAAIDDEEEDGRTVVRGAPKIVKRAPSSHKDLSKMGGNTMPTTISPAAVIKATLESAKAAKKGDRLMAPPPTDLLEDLADLHPADGPGSGHTKILPQPSSSSAPPPQSQHVHGSTQPLQSHGMSQGSLPPSSVRPVSQQPPPMVNQSGGYPAQQSGPWSAQYNSAGASGPHSVPGVAMPAGPQSMPAHFMVPQAPYSDARIDPPGTALTARTKAAGRPAMSWAVALMAFGLFVGVGAFAAMQNKSEVMTTGAAFVDPARVGQPAAAAAQPVAAPVAAAVDPNAVAVAPGVAVPAAPATVAAPVVAPAAPGAAPTVAVAPVAAPPTVVAPATAPPAAAPPATVAVATAAPAAPRPHVRTGGTRVATNDETPAAPPPPKPARAKPAAGTKPAGDNGSGVDEEQKKALKALQESQLESTF